MNVTLCVLPETQERIALAAGQFAPALAAGAPDAATRQASVVQAALLREVNLTRVHGDVQTSLAENQNFHAPSPTLAPTITPRRAGARRSSNSPLSSTASPPRIPPSPPRPSPAARKRRTTPASPSGDRCDRVRSPARHPHREPLTRPARRPRRPRRAPAPRQHRRLVRHPLAESPAPRAHCRVARSLEPGRRPRPASLRREPQLRRQRQSSSRLHRGDQRHGRGDFEHVEIQHRGRPAHRPTHRGDRAKFPSAARTIFPPRPTRWSDHPIVGQHRPHHQDHRRNRLPISSRSTPRSRPRAPEKPAWVGLPVVIEP